ncbi:hypothetical protein ABTZ99_19725 [Actinosynnema sp. NPDC002837]
MLLWLANALPFQVSTVVPDTQKIDFLVRIPSLWSVADQVELKWQVKSTSRDKVNEVEQSPLGCAALRLELGRKSIEGLYAASTAGQLLLALAVQRDVSVPAYDLMYLPPSDRFDWYVLDMGEYFRATRWRNHPDVLYVPTQNKLNLATFSLLWSAHWVNNFFRVLATPQLLAVPELVQDINTVFHERDSLHLVRDFGWSFLQKRLPRYRGEFDEDEFAKINFRTGLAGALGIIRERLYDASSYIDVVRNYCPESLYGTANLWLFSTCYHHFMKATMDIGGGRPDFFSERLLPLPDVDIRLVPRIHLVALWHVILRYRHLGTEVRLVTPPKDGAGEDYSFYGGGIGYFPWISLAGDGANWEIEIGSTRSMVDNIDFLESRARETQFSLDQGGRAEVARLFGVRESDLLLPSRMPTLMFPRENLFLRYPVELFDPDSRLISA